MKVQQYINFVSSSLKKANTNTDTATIYASVCWLILITTIGNSTQKQKGKKLKKT